MRHGPCSRSGSANDKRARGTHIHDIEVAQLSCEQTRAKRPVPAHVDATKENNESHTVIMKKTGTSTGMSRVKRPTRA